jgi:hypothetical protein
MIIHSVQKCSSQPRHVATTFVATFNQGACMLGGTLSSPYPLGTVSSSPLNFNLEVIENLSLTADQIRTILDYLPRV